MNKPIRILQVCQRMEAAGVQAFLMNMYRNVDRTKVQFDFLVHYTENQFYDDEIESMGGHVYKMSVREDFNLIKYIHELDKFFSEHKEYKIIHGHMDTLGALYLGRAKKAGIPIRIAHAHNDSIQEGIKKRVRLFMISKYKKHANVLFACSKNAGNFMFNENEFTVINNAIDTGKFLYNSQIRADKRKELDLHDEIIIGNVGRFHVQKNQLFLLDVIYELRKICNNVKLLLIGSGELEKEIHDKINRYKIKDSVILLSNRHDVNELYQIMDVFVLPSLYEGMPVVGIEAQASGLPCVFSDTITKHADVTGNVNYLPLNVGAKEWAQFIISKTNNFERKSEKNKIVNAGYDAEIEAKKLQDMYIEWEKQ